MYGKMIISTTTTLNLTDMIIKIILTAYILFLIFVGVAGYMLIRHDNTSKSTRKIGMVCASLATVCGLIIIMGGLIAIWMS